MRSVENREVNLPLGIIVEKRKSKHPWSNWSWKPIAVFVDEKFAEHETLSLREGEGFKQYVAGTLMLNLHRKDTEALRINLMLSEPELYVVLRENEEDESDYPYFPYMVTASSYAAQDLTDAGDDIIEKVVMPESVAAFIQAFVEEHHVEEEFKKRRRDRINMEDQKFGKTPIFQTHTKH